MYGKDSLCLLHKRNWPKMCKLWRTPWKTWEIRWVQLQFFFKYDLAKIKLIDCCARHFLSQQPDFFSQKCEIEKLINKWHNLQYCVLFYSKFHCKLNHIEHFWAHAKRYAQDHCNYTLEGLWIRVPEALASVKNHTILEYYKGYVFTKWNCIAKG